MGHALFAKRPILLLTHPMRLLQHPRLMKTSKTLKNLSKGLAGAVAIASGTSAYGTITVIAPPADLTNTPGGGTAIPGFTTGATGTFTYWDINSDGTNDFLFYNRYPNTAAGSSGVVWQMGMDPATTALATTNGVVGYQGAFVRYASAFAANTSFGAASAFSTTTQVVLGSRYSYGANGVFNYGGFASGPGTNAVAPGTQAYAGFRFNAADGTHYGWIRLSVNAGIIDFTSAAWESTPNTPIAAGAVPEPSTLAGLAVGAVALVGAVAKRRRQRAAA